MLKIYTLPVERQKVLFDLLSDIPKRVRYKMWAKKEGVTKKEWHALNGYLHSREYTGAEVPKKRKKAIKIVLEAKELNKLPYNEYLQTDHWKQTRRKVKRKFKRCVICNSSGNLHVHHRSYKWKGHKDKEINDLVLLCRDCHYLFHDNQKAKKEKVDYGAIFDKFFP
jgi:hypothetical protein